jgi:hypothetical protein
MAKRQTTVRIDPDLDQPLEEFMGKAKINLTELFNAFLRELLGIEKAPSLLDRVEDLDQEVNEIKKKLDV